MLQLAGTEPQAKSSVGTKTAVYCCRCCLRQYLFLPVFTFTLGSHCVNISY